VLIVTGLATYPIPGPPSTLMVIAGAALVARSSEAAARFMDGLEIRVRARFGRRRALAAAAGTAVLLVLGSYCWSSTR
jgi:hypothetical protein